MVDKAISDGKILEGQKDHYLALAEKDFETVKNLLGDMPAHRSVSEQIHHPEGTCGDELISFELGRN